MSDESTRYVRTGLGELQDVAGRKALYVREQKGIHVFSDTAFMIYETLSEPTSLGELAEALAGLTEGDRARVGSDVAEAVDQLVERGLARIAD